MASTPTDLGLTCVRAAGLYREAERRMSMAVEEKAQAVKEIVAAKAKHREEAAKAVESHLVSGPRLRKRPRRGWPRVLNNGVRVVSSRHRPTCGACNGR